MSSVRKEKMIENWQIKRLWTVASKIGLDKEDLYNACGVVSLHDLSFVKANEVINKLSPKPKYNEPYIDYKKQNSEAVAGMISAGQKRKIWALMYELKSLDKKVSDVSLGRRLSGVIKRELSINSDEKNPFIWLDYKNANKLIEILKKYIKNARKRSLT